MKEKMTGIKKKDEGKEVECLDDTSPVEIEEGVSDRKYDKNEKNDEEKEAERPDDTSPINVEEGVKYIKDDRN